MRAFQISNRLMNNHNHIVVYEFDKLGTGEKAEASNNIVSVPAPTFAYLKRLCLCELSESRFLSMKMVDNCEVLQVKNYAGVIFTPDGTHIEILPKIGRIVSETSDSEASNVAARSALLTMLKSLTHLHHLRTENANIVTRRMPLLEVFITQFLQAVNRLIKCGLRNDYVARTENLAVLKGKLQLGEHVKRNYINKHRFYVEHDEYLPDRPANRLIHSALVKVKRFCRSHENQKLLRELLFVFADVPVSRMISQDFAAVRMDRGMQHYQSPLQWAKLILNDLSPLSGKGDSEATSLLFPMERVFEHYVADTLRKTASSDVKVMSQVASEYLVSCKGSRRFQLKPDLKIKREQDEAILDTKWKLVNSTDSDNHFGLSQSDFYQMYAYGHKYLNGAGDLFLIYPAHDRFTEAFSFSFDFNEDLHLWVMPFNCQADMADSMRIKWPEHANWITHNVKIDAA